MLLGSAVSRAAKYFNNRCAITCDGQARTFTEIDEISNRVANGLLGLGLNKQDRVVLIADNCVEYMETDFALYKSGLIRVAISPMLSVQEVVHIINDSEARAVLVTPKLAVPLMASRNKLTKVENIILTSGTMEGTMPYAGLLDQPEQFNAPWTVDENDIAILFYTGGTTGVPKGAIHTHDSVTSVLMNLQAEFWRLTTSDVFLSGGSMAHANGFRAMTCFLEGAKFIIPDHFEPKAILETVQTEKATLLSTVPTTLIRLTTFPDIDKYDISSLRMITYGAAPMPTDRLKDAIKIFGKRMSQSYGQAECLMAISVLTVEDHVIDGSEKEVKRLASAGRPYTINEVRLVDEKDQDVKPGEVGEVVVRSKIMMQGYWRNSEASAEALRGGFIHTGDLATMDEDGYLFLVDRKKDIIISGGYNIYAREVEDVLHSHPAVLEAAVIGVPDEGWGEAVKAIIVLKEGMTATEEEIIKFTKSSLASFKKPKSIEFVKALPRTSVGKISKKELRAPYWAGQERAIH